MDTDLARFFGDWSQSEKLSEINSHLDRIVDLVGWFELHIRFPFDLLILSSASVRFKTEVILSWHCFCDR